MIRNKNNKTVNNTIRDMNKLTLHKKPIHIQAKRRFTIQKKCNVGMNYIIGKI